MFRVEGVAHLAALEGPSFQGVYRISSALVSSEAAIASSHEHAVASAHHGDGAHLSANYGMVCMV